MDKLSDIRIRPAVESDLEFVVAQVQRISEYGTRTWRDYPQMIATDTKVIAETLKAHPKHAAIFIAENPQGIPLGFIHVTTENDYYSQQVQAHVGDLAVAKEGEGQGVGAALLRAGEEWAREYGFAILTLNVFVENARARQLYERVGFQADTLRYIKPL